jgi:hypothetical protein
VSFHINNLRIKDCAKKQNNRIIGANKKDHGSVLRVLGTGRSVRVLMLLFIVMSSYRNEKQATSK